jgi:hypothetical protein
LLDKVVDRLPGWAQKGTLVFPFFFLFVFIYKTITMSKIVITQEQLENLKKTLSENIKPINEDKDGNYMAKQQLFTLGTLALQMWEIMEDDEQLMLKMIREGAKGYLLKECEPNELNWALNESMEKGYHYTKKVNGLLQTAKKTKSK